MEKEKTYEYTWRNKFLTVHVKTFDEMIECLEQAVQELKNMRADGIQLLEDGIADDYARFVTTDPVLAEKYGFEEEYNEEDDEEFLLEQGIEDPEEEPVPAS